MTSETRGPKKGQVPPHVRERLEHKQAKREVVAREGAVWRRPVFTYPLVGVALVLGLILGLAGAGSDPLVAAVEGIDENVVAIANDGNAIWTQGTVGDASIEDAALALEAGDASLVAANADAWTSGIDGIILRLGTADVDVRVQGVVRLFSAAARLHRDAIEVLRRAAATDDPGLRGDLLFEVTRLRARAQVLDGDARDLLVRLERAAAGREPLGPAAPPADPPAFPPPVPAASVSPGDPSPSPEPSADASVEPTPEPEASPSS